MIERVIEHLNGQREESVKLLSDWLRIPSISTDPERKGDLRRGAEWVCAYLKEAGLKCEIVETKGHPCVIADAGPADGNGPTVLVYGHYDVQPDGDESLWDSPAFEPTIRDGALYARGSADDKGQLFTHLAAAVAWKKVAGKLPVHVKFVIEGEEEIGSPNLESIIRDHRDRLACDYIALSDTPRFDRNTPAITYGTKGMIYKEIFLNGPKQNLHSGSYGGTVVNPGNALAAILASLRDGQNRVTIPGYYDNVRELSAQEKESMARLKFDESDYAEGLGVPALDGEAGYTTLERKWARPTLDVNGMIGGFTGEGASTVIPAKVSAKVSMRIVPDQNADEVSKAFDEAVRAATPKGVKLEIKTHAACGPYVSDLTSKGMKAAAGAVEKAYGKAPVFIREGGSLPILPLFKEVLGADSLMMGFCLPECNAHGPNEFFHVDDLHAGSRASAWFLELLANS